MAKELSEDQPKIAYSEMKLKVLITAIEQRLDKNQKDYWIIKTQLDETTVRNYLAFSSNLSSRLQFLLTNSPDQMINQMAWLTIKKKDDFEKVIEIELEK
jgi:hypothetical protein